jgi:O-antigen/teichoic acid export membrane protein
MSETKKIVNIVGSGVSWSSFQTIITRFLGFFSALLILSRLSVFEYGLIELSLASLSIFSIFLLPGIQPVVISDISELVQKKNGKQAVEHLKKYFNIQLLLSLFAFIVIFSISYLPIDAFQESSRVLIRVLSLSFLISPWRQTFQVVFSSILDFKARSLINILEEVSKFLFLLFMFSFFELGPVSVAFAIIASQFASVVLMSKKYKSNMLFIKNLDNGEEFKYLPFNHYVLGQSFWAMAGSYMNTFGQTCRLWIIKFLLGTEAVGLFSLAQSLYGHIVAVFSVTAIISPILTRVKDDFSKFKRIVLKSIKYQLVASCIIGLVSFFVVPILIPVFFPEYANSMSLFKIIILAIIPSAFASVFTSMYQSMNFQRSLFFAISFKNLSILVFSFVFIKLFGISGIAYEYLLTTVIFTLSRYFNLKRIANISINLNDFISFDQDDKLVFGELIKKINSLFKFKKREKVS